MEFRQLVKWLEQLQKIKQIVDNTDHNGLIGRQVREVLEE